MPTARETELKRNAEVRKYLTFAVALGMKVFGNYAPLTEDQIFLDAERFVQKAEERYGLPNLE